MFKTNNGFMQLIIVMTFMIANLPLLMLLMRQCSLSSFNYLDDKTMYTISSSIEPGDGVAGDPQNLACIRMDFGAAVSLACTNDVYCPVDGRVVKYTTQSKHILDTLNVGESKTLRIVKNWETVKTSEFSDVIMNYAVDSNKVAFSNKKMYLIWNAQEDCWMITPNFINIYGYTSDNISVGKGVYAQ